MGNKPQDDEIKPPRIVHLLGGLRVVDIRSETISIQIAADKQLLFLSTPKYEQLYSFLASIGLTAIGVEFPHILTLQGRMAPDWEIFFPTLGFRVMDERRAWSNIRHAASRSGDQQIYEIASRCVTYLDLLDIRLMQLSTAYNRALTAATFSKTNPGHLFSNTYMREIDAAIHGFVADAGSFRDLVAEMVWRFVVKGSGKVTRFASFLKRAKGSVLPIAIDLLSAGDSGGWLNVFTELRNNIVHVAPVGHAPGFHFCELREIKCQTVNMGPTLHYPLLAANGSAWDGTAHDMVFTSGSESAVIAASSEYSAYLSESIDGLTYAWQTIHNLTELLTRIRIETGLFGKTPTITTKDLISDGKF